MAVKTKTVPGQFEHAMLPDATHDERAREDFVRTFKRAVVTTLVPSVRDVWETRVQTSLAQPTNRAQVRKAMLADPHVQMTYSLRRIVQEQIWDAIADIVERQLDGLNERAESLPNRTGGTLELNPDLEIPKYLKGVDIHCMPTGYWSEVTDGYDVAAGALYDRGVFLYWLGGGGPYNDEFGRSLIESFFKAKHPDFKPKRILEMGCTCGNSLLPYADGYPEAEIWGIDVGAGLLRYAHARAEALGKKVHFSQQNAETTTFPDGHFDLVVSHILMHETSRPALARIFAESRRLLAPGGMMVHAELPQYEGLDTFTQFLLDYDTYYNNEPFWGAMHDTNLSELAVKVGFDPGTVVVDYAELGRDLAGQRTGENSKKASGRLQLTVAGK